MSSECVVIMIKKYLDEEKLFYYNVVDVTNNKAFYIGISKSTRQIYYFDSLDSSKVLKIIDMPSEDKCIDCEVPGINRQTVFRINIKMFRAMKSGNFSNNMSIIHNC